MYRDSSSGVPEIKEKRMQFGDLRGWIDRLRQEGELHEVNAQVDWDCELGTVTRRVFGNGDGPALLFNNIKDYREGRCTRLFTGGLSNYSRVAMMFGLPKTAPITDLVRAARRAYASRVPPVVVKSGPVKENILKGKDIDLFEFPVPRCRMWSVALTNFWWEMLEFGARQTSLNSYWAHADADGVFRGVIAHRDPGVPNWLDAEGCQRGTLAVRFLFPDATPKTALRAVPFDRLRDELPHETPRITPAERSGVLERRARALQRRYSY